MSTLTQGYELQFRRRPPAFGRVKITSIDDPAKAQALAQELSTLLDKGAILPVDPLLHPGGFYSTYFLVSKKDGGLRPILDLRGLNRYLKVLPFHMLTTGVVQRVVCPGEWFTTIDLKDAYFHVPIAAHHQPFLRFAFQGHHYQFRVLPFGLSLSPRVFTRCVAAALAPLQAGGMKVLPYLDDWLVCAPSRAQVMRDTNRLMLHVSRLGLKVNVAKSCLVPTNRAVVSQINHQGGTKSAQLLQVSQRLLTWATPHLLSLRAMWLPGDRNQVADFLSRRKPPPGEWRLHPEVVELIWGVFGRAEVDLFASRASTYCPLWFSWMEEDSPLGQDALGHEWPSVFLYAFPPLPLILPTLQRVLLRGHRPLLVAPFWPVRPWFPLLRKLCCSSPWRLPGRRDLLSQLGGRIWHPDPCRLQLWAWPLQGPTHF